MDILTSNLSICPVLPGANINEVAKRLAACEPAREVLNPTGVIHNACPGTDSGQTLKIRVDAYNNLHVRWTLLDVLLSPLADSVAQMDRSLAPAFFTKSQELVAEDHAVSIDEHEDERVAVLR